MGIDTKAAIFVGLPRHELEDDEELQDKISSGEYDVAPPHYDGGNEPDAIVGYQYAASGIYQASELEWDVGKLDKLRADFKGATGKDAKVYITPYIF